MSRKKDIELILDNAKASLACEGLEPSPETIEITRRMLKGEITEGQETEEITTLLINGYFKDKIRMDNCKGLSCEACTHLVGTNPKVYECNHNDCEFEIEVKYRP